MSVESFMNKHETVTSTSPSAGRPPILQTPDLLFVGTDTARDTRIRVTKTSCKIFLFILLLLAV